MNKNKNRVPLREKIGYSLGDSSANFVFQLMIIFQLGFYTDTFGIKASMAGTILLIARLIDACVDPLVGILADRTNTKWGKYRPWILWTAIPFGLFFFLAFTTPDLSERGKIIYAGITYTLLMSIYSFNNTPYSALHAVMTNNIKERTNIASIRFIFAMGAAFVVQGLTLPLVSKFGQGDDQKGWSMAIGVYALIAIVFFLITFLSTKERIHPPVGQKNSIKQDFKDLGKNKPWIAMFFVTLFIFTTLALWGGGIYYYFDYYMDENSMFAFLQKFGLVNIEGIQYGWWHSFLNAFGLIIDTEKSNVFSVGLSFFNMVGQLITIIGVLLLSQRLALKFGKRNTFIVCLTLTSLFTALFFFIPKEKIGMAFLLNILKSIAYAPTIPLLWAMFGDVSDYFEWKNFRRSTGFVFAGVVFALKSGLGFGGALCGWIVGAFGYEANAIQSAKAILGIRLTGSLIPALTFFVGVIFLFTYKISKNLNEQIQDELSARREKESVKPATN